MLDERELATRPIVQESVQHNARVSHCPLSLPPCVSLASSRTTR